MDINQKVTEELGVKRWQVDAAVNLIDEGYTIPFISRYRKEVTGSLNDEQLRKLYERLIYLRNLEEKKEQVLSSIGTGEADGRIKAADSCCRDTGFRGGSVPAIPTEASYQGDHRKGKGVRTTGSSYYVAEKYGTIGKDRRSVYFSGEECCISVRGCCRGERYHCRVHLR